MPRNKQMKYKIILQNIIKHYKMILEQELNKRESHTMFQFTKIQKIKKSYFPKLMYRFILI